MNDLDVGEVWRKHKLPLVGELIRKLVGERARARYAEYCLRQQDCQEPQWDDLKEGWSEDRAIFMYEAKRDFGIHADNFDKIYG